MRDEKSSRRRSWPDGLAPLRPDDVARARMRSAVLERARPWLERRRAGSVWELAETAALRLAPLAAAAVILFGWMAHRAEQATVATTSNVAVEELVRSSGDGMQAHGPPAVLTSASAPSEDLVLAATLRGED